MPSFSYHARFPVVGEAKLCAVATNHRKKIYYRKTNLILNAKSPENSGLFA